MNQNESETMSQANELEDNVLRVSGVIDPSSPYTELYMQDGRTIRLQTALLISSRRRPDIDGGFEEAPALSAAAAQGKEEVVIPVVEERLNVDRKVVATGTVRLRKVVQEYEEALNEPLAVRTFDIERVVRNVPVETAPAIRQEGDRTVYPIVEERMVLTKQLILREEVWVTRRDTERVDTQVVTLKREHLVVEREGAPSD